MEVEGGHVPVSPVLLVLQFIPVTYTVVGADNVTLHEVRRVFLVCNLQGRPGVNVCECLRQVLDEDRGGAHKKESMKKGTSERIDSWLDLISAQRAFLEVGLPGGYVDAMNLHGLTGDCPLDSAFALCSEHLICKKIMTACTRDAGWSEDLKDSLRIHGVPTPSFSLTGDMDNHQNTYIASMERVREWRAMHALCVVHMKSRTSAQMEDLEYNLPFIVNLPVSNVVGEEKWGHIEAPVTLLYYSLKNFSTEDSMSKYTIGTLPMTAVLAILQFQQHAAVQDEDMVDSDVVEAPLSAADYICLEDQQDIRSESLFFKYYRRDRDALQDVVMPGVFDGWRRGMHSSIQRQIQELVTKEGLSHGKRCAGLRTVARQYIEYHQRALMWHLTQIRANEYASIPLQSGMVLYDHYSSTLPERMLGAAKHVMDGDDELGTLPFSQRSRLVLHRALLRLNQWRAMVPANLTIFLEVLTATNGNMFGRNRTWANFGHYMQISGMYGHVSVPSPLAKFTPRMAMLVRDFAKKHSVGLDSVILMALKETYDMPLCEVRGVKELFLRPINVSRTTPVAMERQGKARVVGGVVRSMPADESRFRPMMMPEMRNLKDGINAVVSAIDRDGSGATGQVNPKH